MNKLIQVMIAVAISFAMLLNSVPLAVYAQGESSVVVSAGSETTFVVLKDGSLMGTGGNHFGQLGLGHKNDTGTFKKIMDGVSTVSAAQYHTVALKRDGSLWGFGDGADNRLPNGKDSLTPIKLMDNVKMASAAQNYTVAVDQSGKLFLMGNFSLGDGQTNNTGSFKEVMDEVKYVYAADDNCLVIKEDNSLWIWGNNSTGQMGDGSSGKGVMMARKVMDDVTYASCGVGVMAIKKDGSLWMWGTSGIPMSNGTVQNNVLAPVKVLDKVSHCSQSANNTSYFALMRDGTVRAFGSGHVISSLMGKSTIKTFTPVPNATNVAMISSESRHLALVKKDSTLWTGGQSMVGRLGYGDVSKYTAHPLTKVISNVVDMPAAWALAEVREAEYRKLIPPAMQSDYTKVVNRSEFCTLAIICIEQSMQMTIDEYLASKGMALTASAFIDLKTLTPQAQKDIQAAFNLNIVTGTGPTTFEPTKPITREQAAKMLTATAEALNVSGSFDAPPFADQTEISSWAKPYLGYVIAQNIMGGVGNDRFDPKGGYERQQAYSTMLRLYKKMTQ